VRRPGSPRRRRSARARPPRYRGVSYGGWSFRERTAELRALEGRREIRSYVPLTPSVWAVRVDFRPLGLAHEEPAPVGVPRVPRALRIALEGIRELRAEAGTGSWELFRDGTSIGRVSRPVEVPLAELIPPGRRAWERQAPSRGSEADGPLGALVGMRRGGASSMG